MKRTPILITIFIVGLTFLSRCSLRVEACIWVYNGSEPVKLEDSVSLGTGFCNLLGPEPQSWDWNLGDGTTATGRTVKHKYSAPGTYTITLTVTGKRNQATDTKQVTIVAATNSDYGGSYSITKSCFCWDTLVPVYCDSGTYTANITAYGANNLTIHNLNNMAIDVEAVTSGHQLDIPLQIFGADSVSGSGSLNIQHNHIRLDIGIRNTGTLKECFIECTKQ